MAGDPNKPQKVGREEFIPLNSEEKEGEEFLLFSLSPAVFTPPPPLLQIP